MRAVKMLVSTVLLALIGLVGCVDCKCPVSVKSPDGRNEIRLYPDSVKFDVLRDGKLLTAKSEIDVTLDGKELADDAHLVRVAREKLTGKVDSPVYKKSSVSLEGNSAVADFGDFAIRMVARDDGVAYRIELKSGGVIDDEKMELKIPSAAQCAYNRTDKKSWGCEETMPEFAAATKLETGKKMIYLPFVYSVEGKTVAVTESDVHDYPVLYFTDVEVEENGEVELKAGFSKYPKTTHHVGRHFDSTIVEKGGRWVRIFESEDCIAKAETARTLPWRVFLLADEPSKLCESDAVFALATPAAAGSDFSWVKPGKVAWDWWNCFDNKGQQDGCTTATYERFIDFAAKNGVEYVIFDEGWSEQLNIWKFHPNVDVPHLINYANERGVGIILWMAWAQVYGDEAHVASHFAKLGAKGFKVDFMDRADAEVTMFLEKFAGECAKNKMIVDYHGVYRPVGLHRTYPNIINYEGIHGLEQMKWAPVNKDMTYNDVACFFIRLSAGPMDYTPGAMLNFPIGKYAGNNSLFPGSVGTRVHQMAMMVAYEAPLQMLCDSPTNYEKNMECFSFMAKTPVVWADTVGLGGCPKTFAAVARKAKDGSWYAAGLNNKDPRAVTVDTKFLGDGEWKAEVFRDAADSDAKPVNYVHETVTVKAGDSLKFDMSVGGGFVVHFTK